MFQCNCIIILVFFMTLILFVYFSNILIRWIERGNIIDNNIIKYFLCTKINSFVEFIDILLMFLERKSVIWSLSFLLNRNCSKLSISLEIIFQFLFIIQVFKSTHWGKESFFLLYVFYFLKRLPWWWKTGLSVA